MSASGKHHSLCFFLQRLYYTIHPIINCFDSRLFLWDNCQEATQSSGFFPSICPTKVRQIIEINVTLATIFSKPMKKSGYIVGLLLAAGGTLQAQEGASAYHFLQFPQSSHTSALGGANISAVDDDVAAAMNNPALLSTVSDRTLSLNFMTYAAGSKAVGAAFAKAFGERHTGAVAAQYLGYGSMDETDAEGNVIGSFSAKDLSLTAGYAYLLNDRWAGGASVKMIYSKYAEFSSLALAVDVGLNYYDVDADFSASLALKNLGVQLKTFEDDHDHVPYDLQLGLSKGIARAPIRFSLTLTDLTRWRTSDYFVPEGDELKSLQKLLNHSNEAVTMLYAMANVLNRRKAFKKEQKR